jgi:carboxyl-terminal processing protease
MKLFSKKFLIIGMLAFTLSCDDNDISQKEKINNWILSNMQYFYYWTDDIPNSTNKSLAPDAYFESLLSDQDRFSWIQENYQELLDALQGVTKEAGFEFVLYNDSNTPGNVIAQLLYVKPNSPASTAQLKRGDVITQINNQTLTVSNYQSLLRELATNYTITYRPINIETESFGSTTTLSLSPVEYAENPNFLHTVFTEGEHKIGYYVYNLFSTGTVAGSSEYNNEMDAIFADFKAQNITELVLDLRFNSGGAETATRNLASLIAPNVTVDDVFAKREYNEQINNELLSDPEFGAEFFLTKFLSKSQNIGSQLTRMYVLTGSRTASASELLINGLKPYLSDIFLIGEQTVGKNVGSISIDDEENSSNTWGMQPIVVKVFNVNNQSDYSDGFAPNILDEDNSLYLYPLGDSRERLLSIALQQITGIATAPQLRVAYERNRRTVIGSSLDKKIISNKIILDPAVSERILKKLKH